MDSQQWYLFTSFLGLFATIPMGMGLKYLYGRFKYPGPVRELGRGTFFQKSPKKAMVFYALCTLLLGWFLFFLWLLAFGLSL